MIMKLLKTKLHLHLLTTGKLDNFQNGTFLSCLQFFISLYDLCQELKIIDEFSQSFKIYISYVYKMYEKSYIP